MVRRSIAARMLTVILMLCIAAPQWALAAQGTAPSLPNPGDTGVSKEEQQQIGLQAMAEVYKQMPVLPDSSPETQYIQRLGKKLAAVIPPEYSWPFQFHVIPQKEINAFALPGGPMFVNTGTLTAAENEAELAGVMAHEMAHVYMQHSIKQAKKGAITQGLAGLLGGILGNVGGVVGGLAQAGVQIGGGMVMMKYSRGDETEADTVGAIILYKAGYNPKSMADFFQKLEQQGGRGGPQLLSSHPNPGNRMQEIQKKVSNWPSKNYQKSSSGFQSAKQHAQTIKTYTAQEIAAGAKSGEWARMNQQNGSVPKNLPASQTGEAQAGNATLSNVTYQQVRPSGRFTEAQNQLFSISYPDNWRTYNDSNGGGLTIAPEAGVGQSGVAYGVVIGGTQVQSSTSLDQAVQNLVSGLQQSNPGLSASGSPQKITVNGVQGRAVDLIGESPVLKNGRPERERDWLVALPAGQNQLIYMVFVAPESSYSQIRPTYQQMLRSLRLNTGSF
ncbi:MAG TPA: M48 family metallopeptidase [Terriglobales bacterium]|nr:M48 family metallopeptidase [Terriglobales bacterium]